MGVLFTLRWAARDLRRRWVQVLVIALIIGIGTGVYAGLGSTAEWRRQSNDESFAMLHMYDLRVTTAEGVDAPTGEMAAVLDTLPDPGIVATAEERFIADTQVDASTADKSILVPGRLVGMDLSDGGPHVNSVVRRRRATGARCPSRTPAGPWCWSSTTSPTSTTSRPNARSGSPATRRSPASASAYAPEYFFVMTEEGGFFAEANFAVLFTSLQTAQRPGRTSGPGQRPGAQAGTRGRPQGRRPRHRDGVRPVGHRPRRDGDAEPRTTPRTGCSTTTSRATSSSGTSSPPSSWPAPRSGRSTWPAAWSSRNAARSASAWPWAGRVGGWPCGRCWSAPRSRSPARSSAWS